MGNELRAAQTRTDAALGRRASLVQASSRADAARDDAVARVTALKQAARRDERALEAALRGALRADEQAASARAAVAGADAVVAREGAALLALYDRLLVVRRRAVDIASAERRADAVAAWRALAAQRDAVRRALAPVLAANVGGDDGEDLRNLDIDDDDDVEALLEKVDMARDLEARLRRRAEAVAGRIRELRDERAVADDVAAVVGRAAFFDEEDRRLLLNRSDLGGTRTEGNGSPGADSPPPSPQDPARSPTLESVDGAVNPTAPSTPPTVVSVPATVERGYAPGVGVAAGTDVEDDTSLAELEALQARLQNELRALKQKQAALHKAATAAHAQPVE
jgi:hypothetical protein